MKLLAALVVVLCCAFGGRVSAALNAHARNAQPSLSQQPGEQNVICERSYTNFAWGYQHQGIYVDRHGNLYRYAYQRGDHPWSPQRPDSPTPQELEAKYDHGRTLIRRIDPQELLKMFSLVKPASKGRYSKRVQRGADQGAIVSQCYVFDGATGRYRAIELKVAGDWHYENLAPSAKELAQWLESLQATVAQRQIQH
jgi:hypothetical protein